MCTRLRGGGSLRDRILRLLARLVTPMHPTNASGNNMSQR